MTTSNFIKKRNLENDKINKIHLFRNHFAHLQHCQNNSYRTAPILARRRRLELEYELAHELYCKQNQLWNLRNIKTFKHVSFGSFRTSLSFYPVKLN